MPKVVDELPITPPDSRVKQSPRVQATLDRTAAKAAELKRILDNFAKINKRFNQLDSYAASVSGSAASAISAPGTQVEWSESQNSQDLNDVELPPTPAEWHTGEDEAGVAGVAGLPPPPLARGESVHSFTSARSTASTASSVYKSVIQDALLSQEDQTALAEASAAAAAVVDGHGVVNPISSDNQRQMLIDIDAAYDELMTDILNSRAKKVAVETSSRIIRTLYRLVGLIMTAIGKGLGLAINYPKLAILIIGLGYLQNPLFAHIVNFTVGSVWTILQYLFGMTTAGQKIGQFINGIIEVYKWLMENGLDRINDLLKVLQGIQNAADDIKDSINSLKEMAKSLGLSLEDLIQIVISMRDMLSPNNAPGRGEALWNMLGHFANGAGSGAVQALLGNGAGAARLPMLQLGGGKSKSKSKTNKKRKSKSNKKGKTKTRRR